MTSSTSTLQTAAAVDDLVGNRLGSSVRIGLDDLGLQLQAGGHVTTDKITVDSWATLYGMAGRFSGQGGEVPDTDTGTHLDPLALVNVPNAGVYSYRPPYNWVRIGPTGLSARATNAKVAKVEQAINLRTQQPNLIADDVQDFTRNGAIASSSNPVVDATGGLDCWRMTVTGAAATNIASYRFPRSAFPSGQASACATIMRITEPGDGASYSNTRLMVRQFDSSGAELTAVRQVRQIGEPGQALIGPYAYEVEAVALDGACTAVELSIECGNTGGATARSIYYRDLMIADGPNASFRRAVPAAGIAVSLLPDANFGSTVPGLGTATIANEDGLPTMTYVSQASPTPFCSYFLSASGRLAPGAPIQALVMGMSDAIGGVSCDILFRDAGGTEISRAQVFNTAVNTWQLLRPVATVPTGAVTVQVRYVFWAGTSGGSFVKFQQPFLIRSGDTTIPPENVYSLTGTGSGSGSGGYATVYVAPDGSDGSGDGTVSAPYATPAKALEVLGGVGVIWLAPGNYGATSIPANQVRDLTIIGNSDATFARPVFDFGVRAGTITKTAGFTKVYEFAAPSGITGQHNWLWLDGVADAETAVPAAEHHDLLRGRAHRLPSTRIFRVTDTSAKAAALAEIDADSIPRHYYSASEAKIYFSMPASATGVGAAIVLSSPGGAGLFSNVAGAFGGRGRLRMMGVSVKYGNCATGGFRETYLRDVSVLGAKGDNFSVANWTTLIECEAAGSGSGDTVTGDGINAHYFAFTRHENCYLHDGYDDGISSHENCVEEGIGMIAEYNGGSGATPAYGAHATYFQPITRKNARLSLRGSAPGKKGGIESHLGPLAGQDDGVRTTCTVFSGVSYGDRIGFSDGKSMGGGEAYLRAYDCKAFDCLEYGFAASAITDCRYSGTGTAKHGGTTVTNSTLIT